jgi:hypothetical protein
VTKLKHVAVLLASCLLIGSLPADVSAQNRTWGGERDWGERNRDDRDRGWRGRDDGDRDRRARDRDHDDDDDDRARGRDHDDDDRDRRWRGRDRDEDDRDRRWRGREQWWRDDDRGRNCYIVRRRFIDRDGDVIVRRSRVCED